MKRLLFLALMIWPIAASAQQTTFTVVCVGTAATDTARFEAIKTIVGATNPATIRIPYKLNTARRCKVNNLTITANITLDNSDGSGVFVVTGQTLTAVGPVVSPPRQMFFNATAGLGTVSFTGNKKLTEVFPDWWGAVGDGVVDSTTAIQSALTAVVTAGGTLRFPVGTYKTTAPITLINKGNFGIVGAGKLSTIIQPSTALVGLSVFKFSNCRDFYVRDMWIQGNASGVPLSGIQSKVESPRTLASMMAEFSNLIIGSDVATSIQSGILIDYDTTPAACGGLSCDQNNDQHTISNVEVRNFSVVGIDIKGANALLAKIYGGQITTGPIGVRFTGGSADIFGLMLVGLTDVDYEFINPVAGGYNHPTKIFGGASTDTSSKVIRTGTVAVNVLFAGWDKFGGGGLPTFVNFPSIGGSLSFVNSSIAPGAANATYIVGATSILRLKDTVLTPGQIYTLATTARLESNGGEITTEPRINLLPPKTTSYTATLNDYLILVDATAGAVTITLPTSGTTPAAVQGHKYLIKKVDGSANAVTVSAAGNGIDYAGTYVIAGSTLKAVECVWDASFSVYFVLSSHN